MLTVATLRPLGPPLSGASGNINQLKLIWLDNYLWLKELRLKYHPFGTSLRI